MRRAAKTDRNQTEIVSAFRACGCTVQTLHAVGKGCPDLLVGIFGNNVLVEVKDWKRPQSERRLTEDQIRWHSEWRGRVEIVEKVEDVERVVKSIASITNDTKKSESE